MILFRSINLDGQNLISVLFLDVKWSPIRVKEDGSMDRKYLKLSYPESSFMEYPREWEERMMFWDDIMKRA